MITSVKVTTQRRSTSPGSHGIALALGSAVLFGASTPASKLLLGSLGAFHLADLLYLGAALGMGLPLLRERWGGTKQRLDSRNRMRLAGAVLLGGIAGRG